MNFREFLGEDTPSEKKQSIGFLVPGVPDSDFYSLFPLCQTELGR